MQNVITLFIRFYNAIGLRFYIAIRYHNAIGICSHNGIGICYQEWKRMTNMGISYCTSEASFECGALRND